MENKPDLRQLRLEKGWSIKEAAEEIGCSFSSLWNWEAGKYQPSYTLWLEICRAYGLPTERIERPLENSLSAWILSELIAHNMTTQELAEKAGYSLHYITSLIDGHYCPRTMDGQIKLITALATVFAKKEKDND